MVDAQFQAILSTFALDMMIFLAELLVFFCIRNKRDNGNVLLNIAGHNQYLRDLDTNDLRPSMRNHVQMEMKM